MAVRRNRTKQTVPLEERLAAFASDARDRANQMPAGSERDELLQKARDAEVATRFDAWGSSSSEKPK
jgi:hypothetical protein